MATKQGWTTGIAKVPMKPLGKKPYFTAKKIAAVLAGDTRCLASIWIPSRFIYEKRPSTFDFVAWRQQHDELVARRTKELTGFGYTVRLESQNAFKLEGAHAVLAAKPDLLAFKDGHVLVSDEKTGQQRETDFWQVLVYMACLKLARPLELANVQIAGEVVYSNGVVEIPASDLSDERRSKIFDTIVDLAREKPFPTTPGMDECRYCDILKCSDRIEDTGPTTTKEF